MAESHCQHSRADHSKLLSASKSTKCFLSFVYPLSEYLSVVQINANVSTDKVPVSIKGFKDTWLFKWLRILKVILLGIK